MQPMGRPQLIDMKQNVGRTLYEVYWEHPWGTHWEPREHIRNLMITHWELEGNMLGTCWEQRKTTSDSALKISGFRVSPDFSANAA
jgi:hypothetical protein